MLRAHSREDKEDIDFMKNDYLPETKDLDIFLEGTEIEDPGSQPIEGPLTRQGEPLGKKLAVRKLDFNLPGTE